MPLYTPTRSAQRYLGDAKQKTVHDLLRETPECGALEIIAAGNGERFLPDKLEYALKLGYKPCPHCLPEYARGEDTGPAPEKPAVKPEVQVSTPDKPVGTGMVADRPPAERERP